MTDHKELEFKHMNCVYLAVLYIIKHLNSTLQNIFFIALTFVS